jgi:hypothetical protein
MPTGALVTGQYTPWAIAVDGNAVYWLKGGVPTGGGGNLNPPRYVATQILQCSLSGCGNRPTVLATLPTPDPLGQVVPSALTLDATSVYWTDSAGARVHERRLRLRPAHPRRREQHHGRRRDEHRGVFHGVRPRRGEELPGPQGIAVDGTALYVTTEGGQLVDCALGGCNGTATIVWQGQMGSTQAATLDVAVDATRLYWTNAQPLTYGSVFQCDKVDCSGTLVMLASGRDEPWAIAVDGANVYWAEGPGVVRCAIGGCGGSPTVVAAAGGPVLALDAANVYFTMFSDNPTDWRISVLPKP